MTRSKSDSPKTSGQKREQEQEEYKPSTTGAEVDEALEKPDPMSERGDGEPWLGLEDIKNGENVRAFVAAVEEAFSNLGQPPGPDVWDEDAADELLPIDQLLFTDWAKSVEDRMEYMGLVRAAPNLPKTAATPIDVPALLNWTKRVWARFAALGQVIL